MVNLTTLLSEKIAWLCTAVILLMACGCAPQVEQQKRFVWPPVLDEARIEYVNYYMTEDDLNRGEFNWAEEYILGKIEKGPVLKAPFGVASDGEGRVYVSDSAKRMVFEFNFVDGEVHVLENNGIADEFAFPAGMEVSSDGDVYVVDALMQVVKVYGPDRQYKQIIKDENFQHPVSVALDEPRDRVYVADAKAHLVHVFEMSSNRKLDAWGGPGNGDGYFNYPLDMDVDQDGNVYVLDAMNARVQVFAPDGTFLRKFGERGTALGSFQIPKGIAVSRSGHVYVTDSLAHKLVVFGLDGEFLLTIGGKHSISKGGVVPGGFYLPKSIDTDSRESIWVVDGLNRMFHRFQYLNEKYLRDNPLTEQNIYVPDGITVVK